GGAGRPGRRRRAALAARALVDRADSDLPARRSAPHPVQRHVDPPARAGRRGAVRTGAARRDLHGGRRGRLPWLEPARLWPHDRRLRLDLRAARRDGGVRTEARRRLRRAGAAAVWPVGADALRAGLPDGGRQQRRPRRRLRRRLRGRTGAVARRAPGRERARSAPGRRLHRPHAARLPPRPLERLRRLTYERPSRRSARACSSAGFAGAILLGEASEGAVEAPSAFYPGSDLLSHAVAHAVPSAQEGLTSVFGMGTGVAPPATPPGIESNRRPSGAGQPNPEILQRNARDAKLPLSTV